MRPEPWRDVSFLEYARRPLTAVRVIDDCLRDVTLPLDGTARRCLACGAQLRCERQDGRLLVYRTPGPCGACYHPYADHDPGAVLLCAGCQAQEWPAWAGASPCRYYRTRSLFEDGRPWP